MTEDNPEKIDLGTLGRRENSLQRKLCSEAAGAAIAAPGALEALPVPRPEADLGPWARFVAEFAETLRVEGFSKNTQPEYHRAARRFTAWLTRQGCTAPAALTPELCLAFQRAVYYARSRAGQPFALNSQVQMLSPVRRFTAFLKRHGYALIDAGLAIRLPRAPRRLPRDILAATDMAKLLAAPDVRTLRGYRDRTLLEVLYATGLRSSELIGLDVGDVDAATGRLRVRAGKGGKDRFLPLGPIAAEYVAGYIRNVRPRLVRRAAEAALFLGWKGQRLATATLVNEIARYVQRAGVEVHATPHTFRHTCATHMLKAGANIRHIQALLGHESITTTERYTRVEIGDLAAVHDRFHPRERM